MNGFAYLLKYSYRNLFRVPKRTLIMILSLSLGCGFIIWDLNFANSGSREIMNDFLTQIRMTLILFHLWNFILLLTMSSTKYKSVLQFHFATFNVIY